MTAATVDERSFLPGPTWPPSGLTTSFPSTERRLVVLADDPCEAGLPASDPEYAGIYLHARYFDPQLGTFLSPDPIGVAGGMNLYGYGLGNPVNLEDRRGTNGCFVSNRPTVGGTTNPSFQNPQAPQVDCSSGPYQGGTELALAEARYAQNLALSGHGGVYVYTGADGNPRFTMNPSSVTDSADGDFVSMETGLGLHAEVQYPGVRVAGEIELGGGVSGIFGAGVAVGVALTFDTKSRNFDLEFSAGFGVGWDVGASATAGWEWEPVDPKLVISTNASAGLLTGSVLRSGEGTPVRGIQGGIQTPGLGLSRTWSSEMTLRGAVQWFEYTFLVPAQAYLHPRPF